MGSFMGYRWISAPLWALMGCRGTGCLIMFCSTGCRAISAPAPGAHPPPPSSMTLVSAGSSLTYSYFSFLLRLVFFPLLNYVIPEVLPPLLMVSALAISRSVLELAGTGSIGHSGSFWQLLTEATPVARPTRYQNLATQTQYKKGSRFCNMCRFIKKGKNYLLLSA